MSEPAALDELKELLRSTHPGGGAVGHGADAFLTVRTQRAGPIKGEANAPGHENEIVVLGWNWGLSNDVAVAAPGRKDARGRRRHRHMAIIKDFDTASTALLNALTMCDRVVEAKLSMRRAGEGQQDFLAITLKNAYVIDAGFVTDSTGTIREQVVMSYAAIEIEYRAQLASGQLGGASTYQDVLQDAA